MSMGHDVIHRFSIPFREAIHALLGDEQIDADAYEVRAIGGCVVIDLINPIIVHQGPGAEVPAPFNIPVGDGGASPADMPEETTATEEPDMPESGEAQEPEIEADPEPDPPAEEPEDDGRSPPDSGQEEMFYQSNAPAEDDTPFDGGTKRTRKPKEGDNGEGGADTPDRRRSQRAGILCNEVRFQKFMDEDTAEGTAKAVRQTCGVKSRAEFDTDEKAGREWDRLVAEYDHWCRS